jgi:ubiquinone/menaquinone biosynthesis C-methylase UbiE
VRKPWLIDEVAHAGAEHLDPAFVVAYDRKAGFDPAEDLGVLRDCGLGKTSALVDLGAGTGLFALAAAEEFGHVVAVDVSPPMLRFLGERAIELGVANVDCVDGGFLSYAHRGPEVDAVYTRNALHHLPDFWKAIALERIAQMLKPGGILRVRDLIYDFHPSDAAMALEHWLDSAVEDPASGYTREEFAEHIRCEHSTFRWLFEPMLTAAGLDIAHADFRRSIYGSYTCIKRTLDREGIRQPARSLESPG